MVVVGGAEKMLDVVSDVASEYMNATGDNTWEGLFGATIPGLYAMMARMHMHRYGTTREQLAQIAVKNHKNGSMNPLAHFQNIITVQNVLKAPYVAEPLGQLDCAPVSDGAAALVLCDMRTAKDHCSNPIKVSGTGQGSDTLSLSNRGDITGLWATRKAAKAAYDMAGCGPNDIDVAEVHDSFTIGEVIAVEDLGFFPKGKGGLAVEEGSTTLGGRIPINTSGGLKARGHPLGATGIAQINELVLQLRGKCGERQVKGAKRGLAHSVGGTGGTAIVHILEVE
jgi:acetyl-CoA C-acetyltransferase